MIVNNPLVLVQSESHAMLAKVNRRIQRAQLVQIQGQTNEIIVFEYEGSYNQIVHIVDPVDTLQRRGGID